MTARKRWYQLSMLQLLLAMAVVAVFVYRNTFISVGSPVTLPMAGSRIADEDDWLIVGTVHSGWPLPYWHAYGPIKEEPVTPFGDPQIVIGMLVADLAICAVAVVLVTAVAGLARWPAKSQSPSP